MLVTEIWSVKGAQGKALEIAAVLDSVGEKQDLRRRERNPERLSHFANGLQRGSEVDVVDIEPDVLRLDRVIEACLDAVSAGDLRQQRATVAAKLKVMRFRLGAQLDGHGLLDHTDRLVGDLVDGQGVAQALERVGICGVVLKGATEFGHRDDFVVRQHGLVAALDRLVGQLLAGKLPRCDVVKLGRIELRGAAELRVRPIEIALLLQLHACLKLSLGFGRFFLADVGHDGRTDGDRRRCGADLGLLLGRCLR